ncbi:MAG TPA: YbdD/YjiX family protein [Gemmatimonadaceae bacterium]
MTRITSAIRAVLGVPDYDRYLTHMRSAHPGDRVMSETEFRHTWMNDRYNRPGTRCC